MEKKKIEERKGISSEIVSENPRFQDYAQNYNAEKLVNVRRTLQMLDGDLPDLGTFLEEGIQHRGESRKTVFGTSELSQLLFKRGSVENKQPQVINRLIDNIAKVKKEKGEHDEDSEA